MSQKFKTTFIRSVNRTMSYEDRRGYVCICMYDRGRSVRVGAAVASGLERTTGDRVVLGSNPAIGT